MTNIKGWKYKDNTNLPYWDAGFLQQTLKSLPALFDMDRILGHLQCYLVLFNIVFLWDISNTMPTRLRQSPLIVTASIPTVNTTSPTLNQSCQVNLLLLH